MDVGQVLVALLSFPVLGLLLFALAAVEKRLPGDPSCTRPRERGGQKDDRMPAERQRVIRWPAGHVRQQAGAGFGKEQATPTGTSDGQYRRAG